RHSCSVIRQERQTYQSWLGGCNERRTQRPSSNPGQHDAGPRQSAVQSQRQHAAAQPREGWPAEHRLQRRNRQGKRPDQRGRTGSSAGEGAAGGLEGTNSELLTEFTYFVLAIFVGIEVISKVPTILHTPLMSGTNAIHGIIVIGAILIAANATSPLEIIVGFAAVLLATLNVVGGFVVTDRMLEMFKGRQAPAKQEKK